MLSLVLSLFLMPVDVVSCNEQGVRVMLETEKTIDFFNLLFDDSKVTKACEMIMNGNKVEIIEEKMVEHAFYIVVDGILLQEEAIQQDWARINDRNPSYLYANRMKKKNVESVNALPVEKKMNRRPWLILGTLLLVGVFLGWILTKL